MISLCDRWCNERGETMAVSSKRALFSQDIILMGVRWYVAYPLSTRHVEELMPERGVNVDRSTINREDQWRGSRLPDSGSVLGR
jgi:transposase-like protein